MQDSAEKQARQFAGFLDREDYESFFPLLAEDCVYESPGGRLCGPKAIVESYRENGKRARRLFDAIAYSSEVIEAEGDLAVVRFVDRIRQGGQVHIYECRQQIFLGPDQKIVKIVHQEIKGERERLDLFLDKYVTEKNE